jgi:menaquinone-dependent protoporphyrinogen IX oxidase
MLIIHDTIQYSPFPCNFSLEVENMKALIAFFSKTGTTEEIARELKKILDAHGIASDLRDAASMGTLEGYDRVIFGFPINGMRPIPEAAAFIAAHSDALRQRKTEVFAVSYMHGRCRPMWNGAIEKNVAGAAVKAGGVDALAHRAIFSGRVKKALPGLFQIVFGIPKDTPLDVRDWDAIRAWGEERAKDMASK